MTTSDSLETERLLERKALVEWGYCKEREKDTQVCNQTIRCAWNQIKKYNRNCGATGVINGKGDQGHLIKIGDSSLAVVWESKELGWF